MGNRANVKEQLHRMALDFGAGKVELGQRLASLHPLEQLN